MKSEHRKSIGNYYDIDLERDNKIFAGLTKRGQSLIIDIMVFTPLLALNFFNSIWYKNIILHVLIFIVLVFLKVIMEHRFGGTIGKLAVRLRLANEFLRPLSFWQVLMRNALPITSFILSFFYGVLLYTNESSLHHTIIPGLEEFNLEALISLFLIAVHIVYLVSFFCIYLGPKKQALHDIWSGSFCILKK